MMSRNRPGWWSTMLLAAAFASLGYADPAARYGAYNGGRLTPSEVRAVNAEGQGKWKEIRWARSPEAAVAQARSEDKPLFVFIVVGEHGQQNADHC